MGFWASKSLSKKTSQQIRTEFGVAIRIVRFQIAANRCDSIRCELCTAIRDISEGGGEGDLQDLVGGTHSCLALESGQRETRSHRRGTVKSTREGRIWCSLVIFLSGGFGVTCLGVNLSGQETLPMMRKSAVKV